MFNVKVNVVAIV